MVNREINLMSAHRISEIIEEKIQNQIPEVAHATIHLEPFIAVPKNFNVEDTVTEEKIKKIVEDYPDVKKVGRILSLKFENILKIDIDCSFDKELSIEKVHDLTSEIEHVIRLEIKNSVITIHPEPN
jgi:divalent metal cation (Fe/Co/Zn/Cd) transporter